MSESAKKRKAPRAKLGLIDVDDIYSGAPGMAFSYRVRITAYRRAEGTYDLEATATGYGKVEWLEIPDGKDFYEAFAACRGQIDETGFLYGNEELYDPMEVWKKLRSHPMFAPLVEGFELGYREELGLDDEDNIDIPFEKAVMDQRARMAQWT